MRGEHPEPLVTCAGVKGSSPHARGAHLPRARRGYHRGIIPACAGSTAGGCSSSCSPWDHPRMRGEHRLGKGGLDCALGSSPHARGAPGLLRDRRRRRGIIPACAGSTRGTPSTSSPGRDHPRMRGEHLSQCWTQRLRLGSSPHARGALRIRRELPI